MALLILELGVIFHLVIIDFKLGTAFEGLGIGARMSSILFPKTLKLALLVFVRWLWLNNSDRHCCWSWFAY
jgi:hypothetical protein